MISDLRQLVSEITDLTGAQPPGLMEENAPVLGDLALRADLAMYMVGLIGGKDVGKSALVNALVGQEITARTSYGPGTEIVIAYAHQEIVPQLRPVLEREVPGQHRIVTHALPHLRHQVLLDLPDIDSHYAHHIEVTRRMLKHMLFPIWMQSIEKYADRRPRELLAMVSAGNDPRNFIFCLNKVDQAIPREGEQAVRELSEDYAGRIAQQLKLNERPRVFLISAIHPGQYDLPALRQLLSQQKTEQSVGRSRQLAQRQQGLSLMQWIDQQALDQRLAALDRVQASAEEEVAGRIGVPLIDCAVPALLDDPAYRLALADQLMQQRVSRWPIVNILHVLVGPMLSVFRLRLPIPQQRALMGTGELVDLHLQSVCAPAASAGQPAAGQSIASLIQTTFAYLQQSSPQVGRLYGDKKLWEPAAAEAAAADLRQRLSSTVDRQRTTIRSRVPSHGFFGAFFRILLTIGALIWFPFAQPILEAYLQGGYHVPLLAVQVLGVNYLLKNVVFLLIYYLFLWAILQWHTQRRLDRWLGHWKTGDNLDPTLSLTGQVVEWTNDLLLPLRAARQKLEDLMRRTGELRSTLTQNEAA